MLLAYLDTGTGAFLVQLLIGGIAGLGIFLKMRWQQVRRLFRRKSVTVD